LTEYLTEQEQIELLKAWIKQYSLVILAGVLIAVITISGWRYWQQRQNKILSHASAVYDEMLTMRAQNDGTVTLIQAQKLFNHYPQTTYGKIAAFMLARDAILKKNYPEAEKQFNWVIDNSKINSIRQIARIRLARVFIAEKKPKDAVNELQTVEDKSFDGLTDEVRGDAYLAMNNTEMARQSYQHALAELPNADVIRPLLRMKYDNLAITTIQSAS
jgi:predicted negative regulator of RcsB-dependent stress response